MSRVTKYLIIRVQSKFNLIVMISVFDRIILDVDTPVRCYKLSYTRRRACVRIDLVRTIIGFLSTSRLGKHIVTIDLQFWCTLRPIP